MRELRDGNPGALWSDLRDDLRFAARSFRRNPVFSAAVVFTLAIALGGTTAIFGAMYGVYRGALPFQDADRLVRLRSFALSASGGERVYNMPDRDVLAVRSSSQALVGVAATRGYDLTLVGDDLARRVRAIAVSEGWTGVLGVEPVLGRTFTEAEAAAGRASGVALLSNSLWRDRFGGDPAIVGSTIRLDEGVVTVVGVMPPNFNYPYDAELWSPLRLDPTNVRGHDLNVVARMADEVDIETLRADLARVFDALRSAAPGTVFDDGIHVATVREDFIRDGGRIVIALLIAVAFLLLLACVNVANLLAARFVSRSKELGVRAALGAGRGRQFRQLLTETVTLFVVGGVGGLVLASWLSEPVQILIPSVLREQLGLGTAFGPAVVLFTLGLSLAAGIVIGLAAAARASRSDLFSALYGAGRGASTGRSRLQDGLVVAELALCVVLLVGAGVMAEHFSRLRQADLGFDVDQLYTLRIPLQQDRYMAPEARSELVRRIEEEMESEPGVVAVGFTSVNPLCCGDWGAPIQIEGVERANDDPPLLIHHRYATRSFFEVMGIPLLRGSHFDEAAGLEAAPTVIVDESLANRFWPGDDPIGQRMRWASADSPWRTVVGVVADTHMEGDYAEAWYLPFHQDPTGRSADNLHAMVRVTSDPAVDAARRTVSRVDPNLATYDVASMASLREDLIAQDRLGSMISVAFAGFGLVLATFGLYGLLAYLVDLRSREIGTRIALGASRESILWMVLRRGSGLLAAGLLSGIVGATFLNLVLRSVVVGVEVAGPGLLLPLVGFLTLVVTAAALIPAHRATRVDPAEAFRSEP